jgi:hypothetical protein
MLFYREDDQHSEMEAIHAGRLDEIARCGVIFFEQARPQTICVTGEPSSARDQPATEQMQYPPQAAPSRSGITAEHKPCDRREAVAGYFSSTRGNLQQKLTQLASPFTPRRKPSSQHLR